MPSVKTSVRNHVSWLLSLICLKTLDKTEASSLFCPPPRGRKLISLRLAICSPSTVETVVLILLMVRAGRRNFCSAAMSVSFHCLPKKNSRQA